MARPLGEERRVVSRGSGGVRGGLVDGPSAIFVAGLWWVGAAFLVDADKFAWALPLGVLALPAGLAVFPACGFALARLLWTPGPLRDLCARFRTGRCPNGRAASCFTGFPWNDLGMALGANLALAQIASLVGLHGLTFLAIAIFAAPATLWRLGDSRFVLAPTLRRGDHFVAHRSASGRCRLSAPAERRPRPASKLRLIQPNISQGASFAPENRDAILRRYLALSDRRPFRSSTAFADVTHLIWPESAFPFILSRDAQALAEISGLPARRARRSITGAARVEADGAAEPRYYQLD